MEFLSRFLDAKRFDVIQKVPTNCISLDSLEIPNFDFFKIDIQGAEDDVLKGASNYISSALGLELEVEFIELYKNQPLFGDVCKTLSQHDFEFIDFVSLHRWERDAHTARGQCVFGDALFLRPPEYLAGQSLDINKWSAYFTILLIYQRHDLIEVALKTLPDEFASEFQGFRVAFSRVKNRDILVRKVHSLTNRLLSLLGNTYRSHLIQ